MSMEKVFVDVPDGEVVVVNEKFGVRLTDVVSQFGLGDLAQTEKAG